MSSPEEWADASKRVSDEMRLHISMGMAGQWAAFALADGSSDHKTYPSKADAVKAHGSNSDRFMYVKIPMDDMPPEHAMRFLMINRQLFEAGFKLTDPDTGIVMPQNREDMAKAVALLSRKGLN